MLFNVFLLCLFLRTQLEDEDKIHLMSLDEDDDQCIRLLSFCKKHRQPSNERPPADDSLRLPTQLGSSYVPASNPSGCARSGRDISLIHLRLISLTFFSIISFIIIVYKENIASPFSYSSIFSLVCMYDCCKLSFERWSLKLFLSNRAV